MNSFDSTTLEVLGDNGETYNRQRCEIYARVMGYYRPISYANLGKRSEFYSRKNFSPEVSLNSQFLAQYK